MTASDARYAREIKSKFAMSKAVLNKKEALFTSELDLNIWRKLVNCCILSIALSGPETWTLQKVDQKYLQRFEMWCWRRMEKSAVPIV